MKFITTKSLILLLCMFNFNASADKQCPPCQTRSTEKKDAVSKNNLEAKVLQSIKAEFQASNVDFNIPDKMKREFEAKKKFIIDNLRQKMATLNVDYVEMKDINVLVQQTFSLFIKRVEYCQISDWVNDILANAKNNSENGTKRSCLNVGVTKGTQPPYRK